jgi:hypothetical protein
MALGSARELVHARISVTRLAALVSAVLVFGLLASGCAPGNIPPSPGATNQAAPSAVAAQSTAPTGSASATPQCLDRTGVNGRIVFNRTDDDRSTNSPFVIDADGSHETALHDGGLMPGIWSRDGCKLLVAHLVVDRSPLPGAETAWIRPAVVNADGSGFVVLDAYPDRKMQLAPIAWSADGSKIFLNSGGEDMNPSDVGLYTARSSDGGDLTRVMIPPPAAGTGQSFQMAPDGTHILVNEVLPRKDAPDLNTLLVTNADGTGARRLSPDDPNITLIDLEFWDAASEAWSPDGSRIAFCVHFLDTHQTGLFHINRNGFALRQLVPQAVGAISARWSPGGQRIAITNEIGDDNQIWVIGPDGTGLTQLTDGADGSTSIVPVWSPDGSKLLFQRKKAGAVTLWTMNADGSDQKQLSPTPVAADWVGDYAWWPALGN